MNRFDDAVQDLLSSVPSGPEIDGLRARVRRRRRRRAVALVATVGVISGASVGVAASLGHASSGPHIAVSPTSSTTSTTTTASGRCPEVDVLLQQEAALEAQANRLDAVLRSAIAAHAADAGTLDAQHQAVLRQLSDVTYRRLRLDYGAACAAANDAPAPSTTSVARDCADAIAADKSAAYAALENERQSLRAQETQVNRQLLAALAANSAEAGVLDAQHQAILRLLSDVERQIVAVEIGPPPTPSDCAPAGP